MAARILDRNKATLGAPPGDLPGGNGREAGQAACLGVWSKKALAIDIAFDGGVNSYDVLHN